MSWYTVRAVTVGAILIATLLIAPPALACREIVSIISSQIPRSTDAPVIAHVTVTRTAGENGYFWGFARVDKVIKGKIDAPTVKLIYIPTSCVPEYPVGKSGFVAGTLGRESNGSIEFFPRKLRGS